MSDIVISVENLGKKYRIAHQNGRGDGLRHVLQEKLTAPLRWLLRTRDQKSEVRSQDSEVRSQKSELRIPTPDVCPPSSALRPLPSAICPPISAFSSQEDFWALKDVS